jgi:hypothetical protein
MDNVIFLHMHGACNTLLHENLCTGECTMHMHSRLWCALRNQAFGIGGRSSGTGRPRCAFLGELTD